MLNRDVLSYEQFSGVLMRGLKLQKERYGLTYADIGKFCGVDSSSVYRWFSGDVLPNSYCYYCLLELFRCLNIYDFDC